MEEIWKDIPGFEGLYEASTLGRFRSIERNQGFGLNKRKRGSKILKQSLSENGYFRVTLFDIQSNRCRFLSHRLILITFKRNPLEKEVANHLNGIKTMNTPENLEWCTQSENCIHAFENGLRVPITGNSKLTLDQVKDIRSKYKEGKKASDLAILYNISPTYIYDIIKEKHWKITA